MICSISKYRTIIRDYDSFDGDVQEALEDAQIAFEEATLRHYEKDSYTDIVRFHRDGTMYPPSTPVESITSWVSRPIEYYGMHWAEVTYVGGFEADQMPQDVIRAVADMARSMLREPETSIPVGATRVRVGDVSYSGNWIGDNGFFPSSVITTINKWRVRS